MVDSPNVLCVGGTMPDNSVLYVLNGNTPGGSNYGANSVDMGAPGINLITTAPGSTYEAAAGTSYSAPLTAAVAGLLQGVLGLTSDGNGTGLTVKNLLMGSGDFVATLPFRSQRKLNASRAIASAVSYVSNGTLRKPACGRGTHPPHLPRERAFATPAGGCASAPALCLQSCCVSLGSALPAACSDEPLHGHRGHRAHAVCAHVQRVVLPGHRQEWQI